MRDPERLERGASVIGHSRRILVGPFENQVVRVAGAERNEVGLRRRRHVGRALITAVVRQLSDEQFWHWTARHVGHHRSSSLTVPYADFGTKERKRRELSTRMA